MLKNIVDAINIATMQIWVSVVSSYAGGENQRVAIARLLLKDGQRYAEMWRVQQNKIQTLSP